MNEACPQCGKPMDFYEKDTSSGRDWRTYHCKPCNKYVDVDFGVAMWKLLSDARDEGPPPETVSAPGGRLVAVRREPATDGNEWAFYFINDSEDAIRELVLEDVGYEWGDVGNTRRVDQLIGPVRAREFVLAWRDNSDAAELRMDLRFRLRTATGEESLVFEIPKLYRMVQEDTAPIFGNALFVAKPEPAPADRPPASLDRLPAPVRPAPFAPPKARTVGAVLDYVRSIIARCRQH